jgi:NAD(P)-dependent dehydrogenase (short-subunit alcohol dehydrogenase family)
MPEWPRVSQKPERSVSRIHSMIRSCWMPDAALACLSARFYRRRGLGELIACPCVIRRLKAAASFTIMPVCAGEMKPETSMSRIEPDKMFLSFKTNAIGPILVCQRFEQLLQAASSAEGASSGAGGRAPAVVANMSARVGSIADNGLGGWYSYRCAQIGKVQHVFANTFCTVSCLFNHVWHSTAHLRLPTGWLRQQVTKVSRASACSASKAALNQLTKTLSLEFARRKRGIACVLLHPGTCDTGLSEPWHSNVPDGKLFSKERGARQLLELIDGISLEKSGSYLAWDGSPIPW